MLPGVGALTLGRLVRLALRGDGVGVSVVWRLLGRGRLTWSVGMALAATWRSCCLADGVGAGMASVSLDLRWRRVNVVLAATWHSCCLAQAFVGVGLVSCWRWSCNGVGLAWRWRSPGVRTSRRSLALVSWR